MDRKSERESENPEIGKQTCRLLSSPIWLRSYGLWENLASLWGTLAMNSDMGGMMEVEFGRNVDGFRWFVLLFEWTRFLAYLGGIHLYSAKQANWGWNDIHPWSFTHIPWNGTTLKRKSSLIQNHCRSNWSSAKIDSLHTQKGWVFAVESNVIPLTVLSNIFKTKVAPLKSSWNTILSS